MGRPITTLFMLISVDGKISTGCTDLMDFDRDLPKIVGVGEGLQQYYDIEQTTDLFSLNSGKVLAKIGANRPQPHMAKTEMSFLIIDNKPHLDQTGVDNFIRKSKRLFIITDNPSHPAFERRGEDNLEIIYYDGNIEFSDLFSKLKREFGIERMTIQTGSTLNSVFLRQGLIDELSIVVAPALVGGERTPSLIGGTGLRSSRELQHIKALILTGVTQLDESYLHLRYKVINETTISD